MTDNKDKPDPVDLYKLTPTEFEQLVAELFSQSGYTDVQLVGGPMDQGVDILATKDGRKVAIQVKHKTRLRVQEIQRFADQYFRNPSTPRNLIFVTSAELPPVETRQIEGIPEGAHLEVMDRHDLQLMLSSKVSASQQAMKTAEQRQRSQRQRLLFSSVAGVLSIIGALISIYSIAFPPKAPLDKRIQTVEKALASMSDLETYLAEIKRDMKETQKSTAVINQKHEEAKELQKLTNAQLSALQATLQIRNWKWTILNYIFGFVLGVASSLVASVLFARWKQRKALE
jgi:Holliday junction resolvase